MKRRVQLSCLFVLLAASFAPAAAPAASPAPPPPYAPSPYGISAVIPLIVDEANHVFTLSDRLLKVKPGTVKIVTLVPASAKGYHGVGIDGGPYKDVRGAWVLPGRSSSLTVTVNSGRYTLFDSYEENRALGYRARLQVSKSAQSVRRSGRKCGGSFGGLLNFSYVKRTSCKLAVRVGNAAYGLWEDANFATSSVKTRGFKCRIRTESPIGIQVICRSGARRIQITA